MPVSISGDGAITGLELEAFEDVDVGSGASDGDVLTYDASGDLWIPQGIVPIAGIGSNVVSGTTTATTSTTSTTFVNTSLSATITPTSATSKVLVLAQVQAIIHSNIAGSTVLALYRGDASGTELPSQASLYFGTNSSSIAVPAFCMTLDTPATTSATTYTLTIRSTNASNTANVNSRQNITLIEVAA
jgi:hypothetical protein